MQGDAWAYSENNAVIELIFGSRQVHVPTLLEIQHSQEFFQLSLANKTLQIFGGLRMLNGTFPVPNFTNSGFGSAYTTIVFAPVSSKPFQLSMKFFC